MRASLKRGQVTRMSDREILLIKIVSVEMLRIVDQSMSSALN